MGKDLSNPFRPGVGHVPPYLAGRESEKKEFKKLLRQRTITDNLALTGLRGVGKTVLLEEFKQLGIAAEWLWVGTDMSETASLSEKRLATRLLADLAAVTSSIEIEAPAPPTMGLRRSAAKDRHQLNFDFLQQLYNATPGLVKDKIQAVLEFVAPLVPANKHGMVFAYDEAQNLSDHAEKEEFPLSVLLDIFQSIQRKNIAFLLVLVGLPTLPGKLVEARTSAERMFHLEFLDKLEPSDSRQAIMQPIARQRGTPLLAPALVDEIVRTSGGYPCFIQFICREAYDLAIQKHERGEALAVSVPDIVRKLDADFFAGRWARATDRQRDLLRIVASLPGCDQEFTVAEISTRGKEMAAQELLTRGGFSSSHISQMLLSLSATGFIYKNRHGKYALAIPLFSGFVQRQPAD